MKTYIQQPKNQNNLRPPLNIGLPGPSPKIDFFDVSDNLEQKFLFLFLARKKIDIYFISGLGNWTYYDIPPTKKP